MAEVIDRFLVTIASDFSFKYEPLLSLLHACIPYLSSQDLKPITNYIEEYVLSSDNDSQIFTRFHLGSGTLLVLSEFRKVFRGIVVDCLKQGWLERGMVISTGESQLYVQKIIQSLTCALYRRMACYTAGLDIDMISALSATRYEGNGTTGLTIAIAPSCQWFEENSITQFALPDCVYLEQKNLRVLRKQLNICGSDALAICKDEETRSYITKGIISRESALHLPRFCFRNHAEWSFAVSVPEGEEKNLQPYSGGDRLRYSNGNLFLPILNLWDVYQEQLAHLKLSAQEQMRIKVFFNDIDNCKHGAILIISSPNVVQEEVSRLCNSRRGTRLSTPYSLVKGEDCTSLTQFAEVDGAIFLDFEGNCHAYGVILDGVVGTPGSSARGSRYNSTKTYIEWVRSEKYKGEVILGIVKSEDGMKDLFYS